MVGRLGAEGTVFAAAPDFAFTIEHRSTVRPRKWSRIREAADKKSNRSPPAAIIIPVTVWISRSFQPELHQAPVLFHFSLTSSSWYLVPEKHFVVNFFILMKFTIQEGIPGIPARAHEFKDSEKKTESINEEHPAQIRRSRGAYILNHQSIYDGVRPKDP